MRKIKEMVKKRRKGGSEEGERKRDKMQKYK